MNDQGGDDFGRRGRREPIFLMPPMITALIGLPIAIVVMRSFLGSSADEAFVYTFGFVPARYAALDEISLWSGGIGAAVWTFLTHAFLHEGWAHVLINAAMFAALARPVSARLGTARFSAFLVFATVGGALGHLAVAWGSIAPMIGASGTVSGLLGALLRFVFSGPWGRTPGVVESLREPRVRGAIAALVLVNVVLVFFGSGLVGGEGGGIAWGAHMGGFLVGFLGLGLFEPRRGDR